MLWEINGILEYIGVIFVSFLSTWLNDVAMAWDHFNDVPRFLAIFDLPTLSYSEMSYLWPPYLP